MKKYPIETHNLITWKNDVRVVYAASHGKGENKRLECDLHGNYFVYDHKQLIIETNQPSKAVEAYNNINMEFKGTRGAEWVIQSEENGLHTIWMEMTPEDMPVLIARTCYAIQSEANATLIAAAPDLLEACQFALEMIFENGLENQMPRSIKRLQRSINKALTI